MEYNFKQIEQRWQQYWKEQDLYKVSNESNKPKFYVLDMFPYPSGAGLHVGHPLGYIASDIYARYKRLQGFNVLHPMGFDAYGLPAEQYAIQTGQHPEKTTNNNIARYKEQLSKIGFCYDWSREVRTCDPQYYKWTQWAFEKMFSSYYCNTCRKAQPIEKLIEHFEKQGSAELDVAQTEQLEFTAAEWCEMSEQQQQQVLMNYRLAYLADTKVNWCPALGTVLANDEVSEGLSVRGGHPVEQRVMRQWSLRVSAYAQRLLEGLDSIDWSESIKDTQRNWIGRSEGAEMKFRLAGTDESLVIFTTRADTVFGVTFMVLAPESDYVSKVVTTEHKAEVDEYLGWVKHRTERERISDRRVTGVFTGSYAINPLTNKQIPIYISDYVLAGYGTGAIMAVPAHDSRDYAFAKHFNLPIIPLIEGADISEQSFDAKEGVMMNSGFLNGMQVKDAIAAMKRYIEFADWFSKRHHDEVPIVQDETEQIDSQVNGQLFDTSEGVSSSNAEIDKEILSLKQAIEFSRSRNFPVPKEMLDELRRLTDMMSNLHFSTIVKNDIETELKKKKYNLELIRSFTYDTAKRRLLVETDFPFKEDVRDESDLTKLISVKAHIGMNYMAAQEMIPLKVENTTTI